MLKESIKCCHLAATSGMGKSFFFENASGLSYEQPYMTTKGETIKKLFVLDEPKGLIYVEADWSTKPVKLSDITSLSSKRKVLDLMLAVLNEQWKVSYEYCGKSITLKETEELLSSFTKLVFVGHTINPAEESYAVVAEPDLVIKRLQHIESDHWLLDDKKYNSELLAYHKKLLDMVREGELEGLEVTELEGEFLIDLFESGELRRMIGGTDV